MIPYALSLTTTVTIPPYDDPCGKLSSRSVPADFAELIVIATENIAILSTTVFRAQLIVTPDAAVRPWLVV